MVVLCFATSAFGNQPGFDKIAAARNSKRSDPTGTRQNFNFHFYVIHVFVQKPSSKPAIIVEFVEIQWKKYSKISAVFE